jgi:hypothetical protein
MVHRVLHRFGFDVIRWPLGTKYVVDFSRLAYAVQPDVVVDVGANIGQFALTLRARLQRHDREFQAARATVHWARATG